MTQALKMLQRGYADLDWFQTNLAQIKKSYDKQFVAVHEHQIIVSASSMDALMKELKRKKINAANVLISYVSKVQQIL